MRVCRAGRKPGVEPAWCLTVRGFYGNSKANHPPRFDHPPPIDFLPFGFGIRDFGNKTKQGILADALFV